MTEIVGYAAHAAKESLKVHGYEPKPLGPEDVEVTISHCGICHSDIHLIDNDWSVSSYPFIPGHEIVGTVAAVGQRATHNVGDRVGIGWQRSACHACELCLAGHENLCADQEATCVGNMGGFADRIRTDGRFAFAIPEGMDAPAAAPLLCGGATVFAPIRRWGVRAGSRVGVIGIGGLGHLALRFLHAMGANATAFTSSPDKRDEAIALGATDAASSTLPGEIKRYAKMFDFLLCTVPAKLDWIGFIQTLKPNGVLCLVGAPPGLMQFPPSLLLTGQRAVCGSDIGSPSAIREMLAFASEHKIVAQIEMAKMPDVNAALQRVRENRVRYRMVLEHS